MTNRTLILLTTILIFAMGTLFVTNMFTLTKNPLMERYLLYNNVRGMAVENEGKLYTLNFDQQKQMIKYLNRAIPARQKPFSAEDFRFDRLIIYRFDEADIIITPLALEQDNLIFSTPDWNHGKPLQETSEGKIRKTLLKAYTNAQTPTNP